MHQRRPGAAGRSNSNGTMYSRSGQGSYNPASLEAGGGRDSFGMSASEMNAQIMEQQNNDGVLREVRDISATPLFCS